MNIREGEGGYFLGWGAAQTSPLVSHYPERREKECEVWDVVGKTRLGMDLTVGVVEDDANTDAEERRV